MITKTKKGYQVVSEKGKVLSKPYPTRQHYCIKSILQRLNIYEKSK